MNPPDKKHPQIDNIPNFPERTVIPTVAEYAGDPDVGFNCDLIFSTDSPLVVVLRMYQDEATWADWYLSLEDLSVASEGHSRQIFAERDLNIWGVEHEETGRVIVGEITHDQGVQLPEPFRFILQHATVFEFLAEVKRSKERMPLPEAMIIDMMTERAISDALYRGLW